jgi:DNA polymerase V
MELFRPDPDARPVSIPLYVSRVSAGYPSPAETYVEARIDLNEHLIKHPSFTYIVRATGDSMFPQIKDGDLLVIDRKVEITNGDIVLANVNNEFLVKRFYKYPDGSIELVPDNPEYHPTQLADGNDFEIFGKVSCAIQIF